MGSVITTDKDWVDRLGFEPRTHPCKGCVFPTIPTAHSTLNGCEGWTRTSDEAYACLINSQVPATNSGTSQSLETVLMILCSYPRRPQSATQHRENEHQPNLPDHRVLVNLNARAARMNAKQSTTPNQFCMSSLVGSAASLGVDIPLNEGQCAPTHFPQQWHAISIEFLPSSNFRKMTS